MQNTKNKAFTLVELLVVITILAIISVVAYQNFGWAVDKAVSGRKISDVSTIESSLQQYKADNNFYPMVWELSNNNVWWYTGTVNAETSNTIIASYIAWSEAIDTVTWNGGWKVMYTNGTQQIWAKWTISQNELTKRYLSKDLADPEISEIKTTAWTLIDKWIWRYVYAVYKKPTWTDWAWVNKKWTYYNIAYTIKKDWTDSYITKIVWDFDKESCFTNNSICPNSLIWSGIWTSTGYLENNQELWIDLLWSQLTNYWANSNNQWIPYPVSDF